MLFSILAGVELATLAGHFRAPAAIVRVMPNLAAALGKSPIALAGAGLSDEAPRRGRRADGAAGRRSNGWRAKI